MLIVTAGRLLPAFILAWAGSPGPALPDTIRIAIDRLVFAPANITAKVGDEVEWINNDIIAHTATATSEDFNVIIAPKETGGTVLKVTGDVDYYCSYHPNMKGRISVGR